MHINVYTYTYIYIYISKYKKVGVLLIRIVWSNVSRIRHSSERKKGPILEKLHHSIRIGSTPTFLYFDLSTIELWTDMDPKSEMKMGTECAAQST